MDYKPLKKLRYIPILFILIACQSDNSTETVNAQLDYENEITPRQADIIYQHCKGLPENTQVSIAIIRDSIVSFSGVMIRNDSLMSVNNKTKAFEIGSISKLFTSTLLAQFVHAGKVALDDPINPYFKYHFKDDIKIRFKELANHTSGLPRVHPNKGFYLLRDEDNPYANYDEEKLKDYLTKWLKVSDSRGKYSYSNLGAGLLGYTLAKMGNTTYEQLLEQNILSNYGLKNTSTDRSQLTDNLIVGHDKDGDPTLFWDHLAPSVGAGGIYSTSEDLSGFVQAHFNPSDGALKLTRTKTFAIKDSLEIGLGLFIEKQHSGPIWYGHTGGTGGFMSALLMDPVAKTGVVVLTNISPMYEGPSNIRELDNALMSTLYSTSK